MIPSNKEVLVGFADEKIKQAFLALKNGKGAEPDLYGFLDRSFDDLKQNPFCGIKIPKKLWPKEYTQNYPITNLWKYDLPNAWRLIYTIAENEIMIINIILEWMTHKEYERRFNYL